MSGVVPQDFNAGDWHDYVQSAPTLVEAQDRMEEAFSAGVDFDEMNRVADERAS